MSLVRHVPEASRFELWKDDELAGYVDYVRRGDVWELPHTRIFDHFGGRGLGHVLVVETLEQIAATGGSVRPTCPFIPQVMVGRPDLVALVPAGERPRYGL
ncbi:hypothetical protein BHE97_10170 [Aeromicrobium sp. PE09-221]|uniref:GNAT family N-acetyltransferase n=1 Tax=Aeromicrobium sp. PE09-221 TaxID=1898043 RepID=UPI000B3E526E|nr:GNAT family N-acetyltransferase [Aeromicrobium sp. PE09-221]OUZ09420.1 hypothetical protein BHE97_10170 [Aeromicrobium sp. PE09-221]